MLHTEGATRCCWGYCVHLLQELAVASNFTFSLLVSRDSGYGKPEPQNGTTDGKIAYELRNLNSMRVDLSYEVDRHILVFLEFCIGESRVMLSCGAKRTRIYSGKTKNSEKLLFGQQLHLTTKEIGTKNGQYDFSEF